MLTVASAILTPIYDNLETMENQYRLALEQNKRVIIVRVATPAISDYRFPHTTFADDIVMNVVRDTMGAPPANLPSIGSGLAGHAREP